MVINPERQNDRRRFRQDWTFGILIAGGFVTIMLVVVYIAFQNHSPVATGETPHSPVAPPSVCYQSKVKVLSEVPLSLFSASATVPGLDWVNIEVKNNCQNDLNIKVSLRRPSSQIDIRRDVTFDSNLFETYLQAGREIDKTITPTNIQFLQPRFEKPLPLNLTWEITNVGNNQTLAKDTQEVKLLPRDIIFWDMRTVDNRPLDKAIILASISNWMKEDGPSTNEYAQALLNQSAGVAELPQGARTPWVKILYDYFVDPESPHHFAVQLTDPSWTGSSPSGQQKIRVPEKVLTNSGLVTPWEMAVLIARLALASGRVSDQIGIASLHVANENDSSIQLVLLIWSSDGGNTWQAISVVPGANPKFDENVRAATTLLRGQFNDNAQLRQDLRSKGVVLTSSLAAVNLGVAASRYGMTGLP